jgi:hypothetical protein
LCDEGRADRAAGARAIVDHDRHPEPFREDLRLKPPRDVGDATRRLVPWATAGLASSAVVLSAANARREIMAWLRWNVSKEKLIA